MARIVREPDVEPWLRGDVQANRIASADWGENHPGFCYEFGDPNGEPFIPIEVLEAIVLHERFLIALWQEHEITTVDVSHDPHRTFSKRDTVQPLGTKDWCDVTRYEVNPTVQIRNPKLVTADEFIDPKNILLHMVTVLRVPLGYSLEHEEQSLLALKEPVLRVVIEFPEATETAALPFDTSITALGALAHEEYRSTIYGSDTV